MANHRPRQPRRSDEHRDDRRQRRSADVVRAGAHDPSADQLLHRVARLLRSAHWVRIYALLHDLPAERQELVPRRDPVRLVAVRGLHGVHDVDLHRLLHHYRPLLHGEDPGQVPQLADGAHRAHDGDGHVGCSDGRVLHVDLRLAALQRRRSDGSGAQLLCAVSGARALQLHPADRLFLDLARRHDHALSGHLSRRPQPAAEKGRSTQEDDVVGLDGRPDDDADRHRHVAASGRQDPAGEGGEAGQGEGLYRRRLPGRVEHDKFQLEFQGERQG